MESVSLDMMTGLAGHLSAGIVHTSQDLPPVPIDWSLIQLFRCLRVSVTVKVTANLSYSH